MSEINSPSYWTIPILSIAQMPGGSYIAQPVLNIFDYYNRHLRVQPYYRYRTSAYRRYKRPFPKSIEYPQVPRQPSNVRRLSRQRDAGLNSAAPAGGSLRAGAIFRPVSTIRPTAILPLPSGSQPLVVVACLPAYQAIKSACGGARVSGIRGACVAATCASR
jgi:hypothetical protein